MVKIQIRKTSIFLRQPPVTNIKVRERPNTTQAFDGLIIKRNKNRGIDFFAVSKVISKQYISDDQNFKEELVGMYDTQYFYNRKIGLDYYAVNFQSRLRKYMLYRKNTTQSMLQDQY